jgi:hypothetical protein
MRYLFILTCMLFGAVTPASAQVSVGIGFPHVQIGINLPMYPQFVQVPSYPVYYAPQLNTNYFFYDGMYWVYEQDNWYASTWYNGPWSMVSPRYVPVYVLRVPVRYYRHPPRYFHGWSQNDPPRWGDHWGHDWERQRSGWNEWNRNAAPAPAPLPTYQRQYSGSRYPQAQQQPVLHSENYRYRPSDPVVRQYYQQQPQKQPQQHQQQAPQQQHQQQAPQQQYQQQPPQQHQQQQHQQQAPQQQHQQQAPQQGQQSQPPAQDHGQQGQGQGASKEAKPGKGKGNEGDNGENKGQEGKL